MPTFSSIRSHAHLRAQGGGLPEHEDLSYNPDPDFDSEEEDLDAVSFDFASVLTFILAEKQAI